MAAFWWRNFVHGRFVNVIGQMLGGGGVQGVRNPPRMTTDKCVTRLITTLASCCISVYLVWVKSGV